MKQPGEPNGRVLFSLVSINLWDLPIFWPRHDRTRRRQRMLKQFPDLSADLLLFQEAFVQSFRERLAAALPRLNADPYLEARRRHGPITLSAAGGLLTFSRWPFGSSVFTAARTFKSMRIDERIGRKGWLRTEVQTPVGPVSVANVHLYAGTRPTDARVRTTQVRQLTHDAERWPPLPTILAGDFNMTAELERPDRGPTGFDLLAEAGFVEVAGGSSDGLVTMAPSVNRYARYTPWHKPDRRLTQVFYRGPGIERGPEPPTLCLHRPAVSDHFGLRVQLALARRH